MRSLADQVVVITGASSGIGRASAVAFAKRGCHLVLAARREDELEVTARQCRAQGGTALVVVTDVTREADVQSLARTAIRELGRIDVWVNNAGVTLFARLAEGPFEEHRQVLETNVCGAMHGARAVLPHFEERGRGVLINVGSVLSLVGQPFVPSYVISKFAIRGLTEALRAEVAERYPDVHVCSLLPYAVDTPHFDAGANLRHRHARPVQPTQPPERVARAMVSLAERPRRQLLVPRYTALGVLAHAIAPRTMERLLVRILRRWHFDGETQPATTGNLRSPGAERGTHGERGPRVSLPVFTGWVLLELVKLGLGSLVPGRAR